MPDLDNNNSRLQFLLQRRIIRL